MGYWSEIKNDFFETAADILPEEGDVLAKISIDAWKTFDDEQGSVIACVMLSKHGDVLVDYRDGVARIDEAAQEAINEAKEQLREHFIEHQKEVSKAASRSLGNSMFMAWEDLDVALNKWAKEYFGDHVASVGNRDENDFEISLSGLSPDDYEKYVKLFDVYDKEHDYEPDEEDSFGVYGTILPAEMVRLLMPNVLGETGLASYGTALATYNGVFFMEKDKFSQEVTAKEPIQNYEDAIKHLCDVLNKIDYEMDNDDVRTPIEIKDFIPIFKSTNYFGVYCYHADHYYDGTNEYYLVNRNTGEHTMVLGDSFEFIGKNHLDCMKDEQILNVANKEFLHNLVHFSLENVKNVIPPEQLTGIAVLDAALRAENEKGSVHHRAPSLVDQIKGASFRVGKPNAVSSKKTEQKDPDIEH